MCSLFGLVVLIIVGIVKWEIQELLAQGCSEQSEGEDILGLLPLPQRRQNSEAPTGSPCQGWPTEVPGFHMVTIAGVHPETLQGRHEYPPKLHRLAYGPNLQLAQLDVPIGLFTMHTTCLFSPTSLFTSSMHKTRRRGAGY